MFGRKEIPAYYDWKPCLEKQGFLNLKTVGIDDEGLRDGLQGVSRFPTLEESMRYVDLAVETGVSVMTVGIYSGCEDGDGNKRTIGLLKYLRDKHPNVIPVVLTRTKEVDINWATDCTGINPGLEAIVFMGSSAPRMFVQGWSEEHVLDSLRMGIYLAKKRGLKVIAATEDTTRTDPAFLREILKVSVDNGANSFCIADTVGTLDPGRTGRLLDFVGKTLGEFGGDMVGIEFHGHNDLGLALANSLVAARMGVSRVHATSSGIGERAGNTPLELLMVTIDRELKGNNKWDNDGRSDWNLTALPVLAQMYSEMTGVLIPYNTPLVGRNVFTTQAGIHSDAIEKAQNLIEETRVKGSSGEMIGQFGQEGGGIYSPINPEVLGRHYEFEVGPMSGTSTVRLWLKSNGYPNSNSDILVARVLNIAKQTGRTLTKQEIETYIKRMNVFTESHYDIARLQHVKDIGSYVKNGHCGIFHGSVYAFFFVDSKGAKEAAMAKDRNMLERPPVTAGEWSVIETMIDWDEYKNGFIDERNIRAFCEECHDKVPMVMVYPANVEQACEIYKSTLGDEWPDQMIWDKADGTRTIAVDTIPIPSVKRVVGEMRMRGAPIVYFTSANKPGEPTINNVTEVKEQFPGLPVLEDGFLEAMSREQSSHGYEDWTSFSSFDFTQLHKGIIEILRFGSLGFVPLVEMLNKHFPGVTVCIEADDEQINTLPRIPEGIRIVPFGEGNNRGMITIKIDRDAKVLTKNPVFDEPLDKLGGLFYAIEKTYEERIL